MTASFDMYVVLLKESETAKSTFIARINFGCRAAVHCCVFTGFRVDGYP